MSDRKTKSSVTSKNKDRSAADQQNFLWALWEGNLTLPQALIKANVTRRRLCSWMKGRRFNQQLSAARKDLQWLRDLDAEVYSWVAQAKLSQLLPKCSVDPAKARARLKIKADKPHGHEHPNVSEQESDLLREKMKKASE